jgi:hypothetical protein
MAAIHMYANPKGFLVSVQVFEARLGSALDKSSSRFDSSQKKKTFLICFWLAFKRVSDRVARWYIFVPKIPICAYFEAP